RRGGAGRFCRDRQTRGRLRRQHPNPDQPRAGSNGPHRLQGVLCHLPRGARIRRRLGRQQSGSSTAFVDCAGGSRDERWRTVRDDNTRTRCNAGLWLGAADRRTLGRHRLPAIAAEVGVTRQLVARLRTRGSRVCVAIIGLASLACLLGFILEPRAAAASYLAAYTAVLGTVLGVLLLLMFVDLTGVRWL